MQGLGGTGAQQAKDCSFAAGYVPGGAPLRISWFLVIFFVYQLLDAVKMKNVPVWVQVAQVCGNEFILLLTVLTHEMGHGTMAKKLGGEISQVLLWPFGGICFTTRPPNRSSREKLVDDLKIVAAGPATHFPQSMSWLVLLMAVRWSWELVNPATYEPYWSSSWKLLVPFSSPQQACFVTEVKVPGCVNSYSGVLIHSFLVQAVQMNVMLFMFNVFFPMYPMDGAKLIVCSLQLFCNASAKCAAKVLIGMSLPLAIIFIGYSLKGMSAGGVMPGVTAYMGFMCLMETYKIYSLYKTSMLHTHPLFESARSHTRSVVDQEGISTRLNDSERDDEEMQAPKVAHTELRPFSGSGVALGDSASSGANRSSWLDRLERSQQDRQKSVQQLEEERLNRPGGSGAE
jgi:Zn-dependent protease